jgi:SAM-dependent methyltransferase
MNIDLSQFAAGLSRVEDGSWRAVDATVSYPSSGHSSCFAVEDDSFWFRHRNRCILALVKRYPPSGPIFDIGGGNGFVTKGLCEAGFPSVLVEPGSVGCDNALARGVPVVARSTAEDAGFRSRSLPAVGLFDVLEHIEEDAKFLVWLLGKLSPGGRLYLTVPAYQSLWSHEDVHAGHFRRYRRGEITGLLAASGFLVDYSSYMFLPLVLPILLLRSLPTRLGLRRSASAEATKSEHAPVGQGLLSRMLAPECGLIERGVPAAFAGSSIVVCATKPDTR